MHSRPPHPCGGLRHVVGHRGEETPISEQRINGQIRVPKVLLVGPNGEQVGTVRVEDALRLAAEADLDLVEVAPGANPPVCRLMDYGKYKYEANMKARESRKNQTNTLQKEIRMGLKIDTHDYETKRRNVEKFLAGGDKVKVMVRFRGREQARPERGIQLLGRMAEDVADFGFVESHPRQDGRTMVMVLGPVKKKTQARAEARKRRTDAEKAKDKGNAAANSAPADTSAADATSAAATTSGTDAAQATPDSAPEPQS
ncbi:translation initiation factor IF-3 [Brachybacterium subflavum]|uniref:translation initiation factor IF-3 n=1 Tax=Brachybacterium subflavum TaxID=2585206 RepID=UPI001D0CEA98|nr:translation initiation factor IF-3 [Brachybacterium subflavum]